MEGEKGGKIEEGGKLFSHCFSKMGCFQVFPRVAVLSLQQRLSVTLCVAQWLINTSRRMTPAFRKSLQTNTSMHFVQQKQTFPSLPPHSLISPIHPCSLCIISMADGVCGAVGLQLFHDVSQTHLGLNILFTSSQHSENHNNTELKHKFKTHYSLFRSRLRSKSSPSPLLHRVIFRETTLYLMILLAFSNLCMFS